MNMAAWCLVASIVCWSLGLAGGKTSARKLADEVRHYRDTLEALQEKVEVVVNLEWRINNLEKSLDVMEEAKSEDVDGLQNGSKGGEAKVSLKEINKTLADAMVQVKKMEQGLAQMSSSMNVLGNEVKLLEEWRHESEMTESKGSSSSEMLDLGDRLSSLEVFKEDIGTISHQLQNETHDLREDVANLVGWVRRLKEDFQIGYGNVWTNLTSLWKEVRSNDGVLPEDIHVIEEEEIDE